MLRGLMPNTPTAGASSSSTLLASQLEKYTQRQLFHIILLADRYMDPKEKDLLRVSFPAGFTQYFLRQLLDDLDNPLEQMNLPEKVEAVLSQISALSTIKAILQEMLQTPESEKQLGYYIVKLNTWFETLSESDAFTTQLKQWLNPVISAQNVELAKPHAKSIYEAIEERMPGAIMKSDQIPGVLNHMWGHLLKQMFQNCSLINKYDVKGHINWLALVHCMRKIMLNSLPADLTADTPVKKDLFVTIDANAVLDCMLNFIGQLIKDGNVETALIIHQYIKHIKHIQQGATQTSYDSALKDVFGMLMGPTLHGTLYAPDGGLSLYGRICLPKSTKIRVGSEGLCETYFMQVFAANVLQHPIFSRPFQVSLYRDYGLSEEFLGQMSSQVDSSLGDIEHAFNKLAASRGSKKDLLPVRRNHMPDVLSDAMAQTRISLDTEQARTVSHSLSAASAAALQPSSSMSTNTTESSDVGMGGTPLAAPPVAAAKLKKSSKVRNFEHPQFADPGRDVIRRASTSASEAQAESLFQQAQMHERRSTASDAAIAPRTTTYLPSGGGIGRSLRDNQAPPTDATALTRVAPGVLGVSVLPVPNSEQPGGASHDIRPSM